MIDLFIKSLKSLIDIITHLKRTSHDAKFRNIARQYFTIYSLLNNVQEHNNTFLGWLQHSQKYHSTHYFILALKHIAKIENAVMEVYFAIDHEFANKSLLPLLRLYDRHTYEILKKFIGAKQQRIRFWEYITNQISEWSCTLQNPDRVSDYRKECITFEILVLSLPNVDIASDEFWDIELEYQFLQTKKIILNDEFIQNQIDSTKDVIASCNDLLNEFGVFIKDTFNIELLV